MPYPLKPLDPGRSPQHWFGAELRSWRETRGLSQRGLAALVHVSDDLIRKIETADRRCSKALAARLDEELRTGGVLSRALVLVREADNRRRQADNDREVTANRDYRTDEDRMLGVPVPASSDGSQPPVDRRAFLHGVAATPLAFHDFLNSTISAERKAVRDIDVQQVRLAARTLSAWDNRWGGGGFVGYTATVLLQGAAALLDLPCPPSLRADLLTAIGQMGMAVGLSAFDSYRWDDSRRALDLVTVVGEESGDWPLRGKALDIQARREIWRGNPDQGLTYAELGLVRSDRLTHAVRATLHTARARALAKLGERQAALSAIGAADEAVTHIRAAEEPPFMAYYDHAQHHGDTGHALYDLTLAGHPVTPAANRLRTAVKGHVEPYVRSRAISRTKYASLLMATGDPYQAAAAGTTALDEVGHIHSRRAADDMRELRRLAGHHTAIPEVQALRERIAATVPA